MSYAIQVGGTTIPYHIRERARKRILSLNVEPGLVEVVAPKNTPETTVEEFVHANRRWIFNKFEQLNEREKLRKREALSMPERFCSGAKIPFRGRMMSLTVSQGDVVHIRIAYRGGFHITLPESLPQQYHDMAIRRELRAWLRLRLAQDATAFARRYGEKLHVTAKRVSVKTRRHFWGYCTKDGVIGVNWHLIFAPKQILEYVVAHELCHLRHRHHAEEFWHTLGSVFADWEHCTRWLEKNEQLWDVEF
jgi:predicted metal-dependent hydrolase